MVLQKQYKFQQNQKNEWDILKQGFSILCKRSDCKFLIQKDEPPQKQIRSAATRMITVAHGRNLLQIYQSEKDDIENLFNKCSENCQQINYQTLLSMLRRENELRLQYKTLAAFEKEAILYEENDDDNDKEPYLSETVENLQNQVLNEFGYNTKEDMTYALEILRNAQALYPNDKAIKNSVYYIKYNRCRELPFDINDEIINNNVPLLTLNSEMITLKQLLNNNKPNVLIAGSIS